MEGASKYEAAVGNREGWMDGWMGDSTRSVVACYPDVRNGICCP